MGLKVVPFCDGKAPLTDIPAKLREMAAMIESGEHEDVSSVVVLMPVPGDYPRIYGFGELGGTQDPVMICELAKLWLLQNFVERHA